MEARTIHFSTEPVYGDFVLTPKPWHSLWEEVAGSLKNVQLSFPKEKVKAQKAEASNIKGYEKSFVPLTRKEMETHIRSRI